MQNNLLKIISSRYVHWLFFIVIGAVLYGFTLSYPFVFDDRLYILNNYFLENPESFLDMLDLDNFVYTHMFRQNYPDLVSSFVLRPVAYASFYLNQILSGSNPESFRLFNIAVHISNAILLYSVIGAVIHKRIGATGLYWFKTLPFLPHYFFWFIRYKLNQ
jgi:hypothetical protein